MRSIIISIYSCQEVHDVESRADLTTLFQDSSGRFDVVELLNNQVILYDLSCDTDVNAVATMLYKMQIYKDGVVRGDVILMDKDDFKKIGD